MAGTAAAMVHLLKYGGWKELADDMGVEMAAQRFGGPLEPEFNGVVAVPLSKTRLRERGFNQAELLAEVVAVVKEKRTGKERKFKIPEKCPICGSSVYREPDEAVSRCKTCLARQ